jgi:hypothetical protein
MPRGYPDWFGQPQFPKYGSVLYVSGQTSVTETTEKTIVEITAKGRTYGGHIVVSGANTNTADYVKLYVDSSLLYAVTFGGARGWNYGEGYIPPLILSRYDRLTPEYAFNVNRDITFDSSFRIAYLAKDNNPRIIYYELQYSKIE